MVIFSVRFQAIGLSRRDPRDACWEWNNHPNWLELHDFSEGLKLKTTKEKSFWDMGEWEKPTMYVPIGSMYGIYANIWGILMVNVIYHI